MRGKLSNQDLTNYALNDGLDDHERLYVESMLAVSEECRHDVYGMIEMAQLIETGFDRENRGADAGLTPEQREQLMHPPQRPLVLAFLQQASAAVAMAACVAFMLVHPQFWPGGASARKIAHVSSKMNQMVSHAGARAMASSSNDFGQFVDLHELVDDSDAWLQQASDALPKPDTICTPPSWPDSTGFGKSR
jgi:anti-sigma factor RsiW